MEEEGFTVNSGYGGKEGDKAQAPGDAKFADLGLYTLSNKFCGYIFNIY